MTNNPGSELAAESELHLDIQAGPERAVAATKSYSAQLLALWLIVESFRGGDASAAHGIPEAAASWWTDAGRSPRWPRATGSPTGW